MAKRIGHVVLIGALLISVFHGTCGGDWDYLDNLGDRINSQVHHIVQNVQRQLDDVNTGLHRTFQEIDKTIKNLPRDANGNLISTVGNGVIVNVGNGVSRVVESGFTKEGEQYVRDTLERMDGSTRYHYEIYHKPKTNTTVKTCWKLDSATPGAIPEIIKDC